MQTGAIKWFNPEKGYGFVTCSDGADIFLHFSGLAPGEDRRLFPEEKVEFDIVDGERGPKAVNLSRIKI